jgi:hypothetical protein
MKRLLCATALLLLAGTPYSNAQIVTQSRSGFDTNEGAGDNLGSLFMGPGVNLSDRGGTACSWCFNDSFSNTPGSVLDPSMQIFYDSGPVGSLTFEGHTYCQQVDECSISVPQIGAAQVAFPTNGQNFSVTLPAAMEGVAVSFFVGGQNQVVNLQIPPGELTLSFFLVAGPPGGPPPFYEFSRGTFTTPEPDSLGLMVAGLAGFLGLCLKRRSPAISDSRLTAA